MNLRIRIDPIKWFVLIKMFDLETSDQRVVIEANVSYPTGLYAFDSVRYVNA